jgi:succinate dehydrogenase / fumarate reductase, membrane anchor subunit
VSLVTPLNRVLGLGTASGAAEHWWLQRLTAVALAVLGVWAALELVLLPDFSYGTVLAWVHRPYSAVMLILFVLAVGYHSYLGVQVVIEDYVASKGAKVASVMGSTLAHIGLSIAAIFAILKIAFGPAA